MYKVLKVVIPIPAAEAAGLDHRMIEGDHVGSNPGSATSCLCDFEQIS